ncbi:MAG: efflux RND transporter periplasmic adaptor subunit [Cyanobacteria bacterium P01_G01_bin.38]
MTYPKYQEANAERVKSIAGSSGGLSGRVGLLLGVGLGLAIALLGSRFMPRGAQPSTEPAPEAVTAAAGQSVTVGRAESTQISQTIAPPDSEVQAFDLLNVAPSVSGLQIKEMRVREGDTVSQGQVLAVLDNAVLRSQIAQAEANQAQAQAQVRQEEAELAQAQAQAEEAAGNFDRYQNLFDQGAVSEEQLVSRRTQMVTAQEAVQVAIANITSAQATVDSRVAEIEQLQTQLGQTRVLAPANGVIAERQATVGDTSSTGDPLYSLIQDNVLELAVQLSPTQLTQVSVGAPVQITSSSDPQLQLQGSVRSIDPVVNDQSRQATAKISLPASNRLRVGMSLKTQIITSSRSGIVVPVVALVSQADDTFLIYTLGEDQTVRANQVETGQRLPAEGDLPERVEITSGLASGAQIIVEGASYLQDGDAVTVVDGL